jgi:hypothetical protein
LVVSTSPLKKPRSTDPTGALTSEFPAENRPLIAVSMLTVGENLGMSSAPCAAALDPSSPDADPIDLALETMRILGCDRCRCWPVQRFSNTQAGSEPFGKFYTLLLFSMGYNSVDVIRSAWK